jgi:hypothetical protein
MNLELTALNQSYGHGSLLKAFARLPSWLPLPFAVQHGWLGTDAMVERTAEAVSGMAAVWTWTSEVASAYQRQGIAAFAGGAPFLYLAAAPRPEPTPGRGTLAFPIHGTQHVRLSGDFVAYVDSLCALPAEYQPVAFCLHPSELVGPLHQLLRGRNLGVVSNGPPKSPTFLSRYLENVRQHRFVTSNVLSTALFYAAFLGVPAFLFGAEFRLDNVSDPHVPAGPLRLRPELVDELRPAFLPTALAEPTAQQAAAARQLGAEHMLTSDEVRRRVLTLLPRLPSRRLLAATVLRGRRALGRVLAKG